MIAWLEALAARERRRIPVRLVKGAYWDSEIKRTQEQGLDDYPVFTRKLATDVSYLACARRLLAGGDAFYPQFATHNAQTLGSIIELAGNRRDFEFQRLHGMGEALYEGLVGAEEGRVACRVYAPVGSHQDLLPYLVRRLLENGANTSFVNRILDENVPLETLVEDPASRLARLEPKRHPRIPLPAELYGPERRNSRGIDLRDPAALDRLAGQLDRAFEPGFQARPGIAGGRGEARAVLDPADRSCAVGSVIEADPETIAQAVRAAQAGFASWERTPLAERVACLRRAADLYEANAAELLAWCVREAGKTLPDAVAEVREAVDFLRYYAMEAQTRAAPRELPGPTGESNRLALHGRGVFVAISPWNFPLAIFTGQIAAALVVGNAVLAKPAPQTPLIAAKAVALLHQAGVPEDALILLPGRAGGRGAARGRPGHRRGRVHRLDPDRLGDQPRARRQGRADRAADRRDRRPERDAGRFLGAARAGGRRRAGVLVPLGRSALLGAARAVPAGRHRAARAGDAGRRHAGAARSAIPDCWRPTSAR